jgi:hypothetical protein
MDITSIKKTTIMPQAAAQCLFKCVTSLAENYNSMVRIFGMKET